FEKHYKENMSRDEAIILGIKALSQGNNGKVNPEAIEIGLVEKGVKFHKLPPEKTLEYVKKALGGK
ncbi:MAG: proteasome subunit alpha, partial [Thermoplasmata archaeon]|nr:proteasome subunit alpha [Thermoplasmata archaeon]